MSKTPVNIKQEVGSLLSTIRESASEIEDIYEQKIDYLESKISDLEDEIEPLKEKTEFAIPVKSVLDATKAPILQRMFQNLSIEQLEEVENFARSTVKHPAKYIEYIHEN